MDSCPIIAKEEKKKKRHKVKKKEKEQRHRHKALMSIGMWVDVSSDEDHHKKHSHKATSCKSPSTSHKCLMAKGKNESDVSDDGALSPNELEQKVARLICENESLKAQLASSSRNYEELVLKFDIVLDHNDELTKKIEALELKATSKTCREEEIEVLKQEVDRLMQNVARLQGQREHAQPSQDNRPKVVKKLEEIQTVVCFFCNKEGHTSYMCRLKKKEEANKREGKQKKSVTPKASGRNCGPKQACKELNMNREGKIKEDQRDCRIIKNNGGEMKIKIKANGPRKRGK
ncbi:hypothetical protein U9M48_039662 [Paspalum notatum var. saurae]|uniref:CCHC-type domain-containing protein n=1 Tax=Paspalum notatum var. saurae TaxID=547442 RepID=A0AAQ3XET9_PASNO